MKTGIVMEIQRAQAVLLLPGGEFVRARVQPGWQVGDAVALPRKAGGTVVFRRALAAAACLLLLLAGIGGFRLYVSGTSYISVDINPSFELVLNRFGRVVGTEAYNEEAEQVLATLNLKGQDYRAAVDALLASEALRPYLQANEYINFAVYAQRGQQEMLDYLQQAAADVQAAYPQLQPVCEGASRDVVDSAHRHHMSTGKMAALLELQALDPGMDFEEYSGYGIGQIRSRIAECGGHQYGQQGQAGGDGQGASGQGERQPPGAGGTGGQGWNSGSESGGHHGGRENHDENENDGSGHRYRGGE